MFRDLIQRRYRKVPAGTLTGVVLGLIYLINPLDLIPDVLPIFGVVDDSLVVGIVLALLSCDVKKYLSWKNSNPRPNNTRDLTPPANH